jgi:phage-related tail fiber protein
MKTRFVSLFLLGVLVAAGLSAQTKTSGTATCKADPASPVALTDKPNHFFAVGKAQCTWTKFEVAGLQSKDGVSTDLEEITGDTVSARGYHVATMSNGDTTVAQFQGSGKLKDGKPVSGNGTWSYTSGTGKLKGIKGKGTYKGTANADGSVTYQVDGEYQLP